MRVIPKTWMVILSIALAAVLPGFAADKPFRAGAAAEYANQTADNVTIGAKAYDTDELIAEAFGKKAELLKYGVLPVLIVIENKRQKTLDMQSIEVNLVGADGRHVTEVKPEDIPYLGVTQKRPTIAGGPRLPLPKKKNRLDNPEIVSRALAARVLPPGDSASGFVYFEAKSEPGDRLYLNGLRDTPSGRELLYFEFELAK